MERAASILHRAALTAAVLASLGFGVAAARADSPADPYPDCRDPAADGECDDDGYCRSLCDHRGFGPYGWCDEDAGGCCYCIG